MDRSPAQGRLARRRARPRLAIQNNGLCVVTTRLAVADVAGRAGTVERNLEDLPSEAGAALLKQLDVQGTDKELRKASDEFGGHALALTLLGNYLTEALDGDVRQRGEVAILDEDVEQGEHARRVMSSYASWLGDGPELQVLRLVGLFDRPAEAAAVAALRKAPRGVRRGERRAGGPLCFPPLDPPKGTVATPSSGWSTGRPWPTPCTRPDAGRRARRPSARPRRCRRRCSRSIRGSTRCRAINTATCF